MSNATKKLTLSDLLSLDDYAEQRTKLRTEAIAHKKRRKVAIGPHMTLLFEDRITLRYQIQEILRVEKVFDKAGKLEELAAYNPLIPDGSNWKATCLIEYSDVEQRKRELAKLGGIEHQIWVQVDGFDKVTAIADEDLERTDESGKTSAVHFLRFELSAEMRMALKQGATLRAGSAHAAYVHEAVVAEDTRQALMADLDYV